jgi:hypothetical protein
MSRHLPLDFVGGRLAGLLKKSRTRSSAGELMVEDIQFLINGHGRLALRIAGKGGGEVPCGQGGNGTKVP